MESVSKTRLNIIKGIGIFSIVAGHVFSEPFRGFFFLYHVPLFIFLSGFLYKPYPNKKKYFEKKFFSLLIPYFSYLLIFTIPFLINYMMAGDFFSIFELLLNALLGGVYLTGWFSVFWFITSLFFTQQFFCLIEGRGERFVQVAIVSCLIISYVNYLYFPYIKFPLAINTVFYTLPIFYLGYVLGRREIQFSNYKSFFLFFITLVFYAYYNNALLLDVKYSRYGVPLLSFLISLAMISMVFKLSLFIDKFKILSIFFSWLGTSSMTIMYFHQPLQISLKNIIGIKSEIILTSFTIFMSLLIHELFKYTKVTRKLLLGSSK